MIYCRLQIGHPPQAPELVIARCAADRLLVWCRHLAQCRVGSLDLCLLSQVYYHIRRLAGRINDGTAELR